METLYNEFDATVPQKVVVNVPTHTFIRSCIYFLQDTVIAVTFPQLQLERVVGFSSASFRAESGILRACIHAMHTCLFIQQGGKYSTILHSLHAGYSVASSFGTGTSLLHTGTCAGIILLINRSYSLEIYQKLVLLPFT